MDGWMVTIMDCHLMRIGYLLPCLQLLFFSGYYIVLFLLLAFSLIVHLFWRNALMIL